MQQAHARARTRAAKAKGTLAAPRCAAAMPHTCVWRDVGESERAAGAGDDGQPRDGRRAGQQARHRGAHERVADLRVCRRQTGAQGARAGGREVPHIPSSRAPHKGAIQTDTRQHARGQRERQRASAHGRGMRASSLHGGPKRWRGKQRENPAQRLTHNTRQARSMSAAL